MKQVPDVAENWLNSLRHRRRTVDGGQEVGDARNDADGRFRANLGQRVTESLEMAASQHLGRLDRGVGAATGLVHVVADVGVADQGEDTKLSHLEAGSEV